MQLYLDCDGVLANFDKKATEIFGMHPKEYENRFGRGTFWKVIANTPDFFNLLEEMEDARELYDAVKHLNPIVLTGVPSGGWATAQKRRWIDRTFGEHLPVITCRSRDKRLYAKPGDIIIDDLPKYKPLWEEIGGIFILHTSAKESIAELKRLKII